MGPTAILLRQKFSIWQQWVLHACLLWLVLTLSHVLPYLYHVHTYGPFLWNVDGTSVTVWQTLINHNVYQLVWAPILIVTLLVEANYHLFFTRKKVKAFLGSTLLAGLIGWLSLALIDYWRLGERAGLNRFIEPVIVIFAYGFLYALTRDFIQTRIFRAENLYQRSEAELQALKAQLHPHFFFNTLNNLYGTALQENAHSTAESLEQLSGMMRYVLGESGKNFTSVAGELKFMEDYLHLQRIRIPDRENIEIRTSLNYDDSQAQIAPLLLIPFVENAFKYGISIDRPCSLLLRIEVVNKRLDMYLENLLLPAHPGARGQGTGIANARERLRLLYPNRHQLTVGEQEGFFKVSLQVDL